MNSKIFKILIEVLNKVAGFYGDYFDYSSKISSSLDVTKEDIEQCYEVLLSFSPTIFSNLSQP